MAICAAGACGSGARAAPQCSSAHSCVVDLQHGAVDACLDSHSVRAGTHRGEEQPALGFTRQRCHGWVKRQPKFSLQETSLLAKVILGDGSISALPTLLANSTS